MLRLDRATENSQPPPHSHHQLKHHSRQQADQTNLIFPQSRPYFANVKLPQKVKVLLVFSKQVSYSLLANDKSSTNCRPFQIKGLKEILPLTNNLQEIVTFVKHATVESAFSLSSGTEHQTRKVHLSVSSYLVLANSNTNTRSHTNDALASSNPFKRPD